jgi:membrane-associated protease RseP (regulator of RpoE activity)
VKNPDLLSRTVYYQLSDLFDISAIYYHDGRLIFRARPRYDRDEAISLMYKRLGAAGFAASFKEDAEGLLIGVRELRRSRFPVLNIALFLATVATVFFIPAMGGFAERTEFTIALMAILLFHEFGHYLAGRRRGILMSLPYFIPAPNIIGTFGAVIRSRSPFTNRRDLIEVGAAGPISGFVISVIALSVGLYNSEIVPSEIEGVMSLGDSLLIKFLARILIGPIPEGYDFFLSPAAFAGWVGLLVTMINLLPLGQLDGGHIAYGLIGKNQRVVGKLFIIALGILGFWWPGWWIFGALVFIFGLNHPPTLNDSLPLSSGSRFLGFITALIFIVSFVPVPFKLD